MKLIDQDKANHAVWGAITTAIAAPLAGILPALILCVAVALAKEYLYDAQHADVHTVDWRDAAWTVLGGVIVAVSHIQLPWFQALVS